MASLSKKKKKDLEVKCLVINYNIAARWVAENIKSTIIAQHVNATQPKQNPNPSM